MSAFSLSPLDSFFNDFYQVGLWVISHCRIFLQTVYSSNGWNFLFYTAFLPIILTFCADLIFSFILSFKTKEIRFFNVLSPKSWKSFSANRVNAPLSNNRLRSISDLKNHGRDISPKYLHLSSLSIRLNNKYKKAKSGDIIRCKDGERFVYCGMRIDAKNSPLYAYRGKSGVYYSTMKPSKWSVSTGSQRGASIKMSYKNKK